jgi:hypothetical protein
MLGITTPKKIYTIAELKSLRAETNIPSQSPSETASYGVLLTNRLNDASKTTDRSLKPTKLLNVPTKSNIVPMNKAPVANAPSNVTSVHQITGSNMQWRQQQQQQQTSSSDLRAPRSVVTQKFGSKEQTTKNFGDPEYFANRGNVQPAHNSENRNYEKDRINGQQSKSMSSAEQQRLQFEKEREEIEVNRQNMRKMSGANADVVVDNEGQRRHSMYHDECDILMDELAGKSPTTKAVKVAAAPTQSPIIPAQATGKSNMLMMAMGLGGEGKTQPSPQGMKKISIDSIFSNINTKNATPVNTSTAIDHNLSRNTVTSSNFSFDTMDNSSARKQQPSQEIYSRKNESDSYTDSSLIEADDDYEISMRLIERMICGDDDYDKDDKSSSYNAAVKSQEQPLYSFFDALQQPPTDMPIEEKQASPAGFMQHQSMSSVRSPSGALQHQGGGVSLSIDSLFESARKHELANNGGIAMSHQRKDVHNTQDTGRTTDVLLKLGFGAQTIQGNNGHDFVDNSVYMQGSPLHSTPQKSGSSYPTNVNSQSKEHGSSPFAFHSSSSGGGSSGGGSRRSSGTTIGSSSASTSSRQQLFKMTRVTIPTKALTVEKSPIAILKVNQERPVPLPVPVPVQVPVETPKKISIMPDSSTKPAAVVGKDSGMHRISISDLFKSSGKVATPSLLTANALPAVPPAASQTTPLQSTTAQ